MRTKEEEMKTKGLIERKKKALEYFVKRIVNTEVKDYIGKIFLFGSLSRGQVKKESDIDILLFCSRKLNLVLDKCLDLQMDTYFKYSESIEPLIFSIEMMRNPNSYFLYKIVKYGKEVYKMDEKRLKIEEARNYIALAEEYLEGSKENLGSKRLRIAVDAGYNAAELSAKAMLLLEMDEIPSSHGGIVGEFSKIYVKSKRVPKELGRSLNRALDLRNRVRYDYSTPISTEEAEETVKLATEMIEFAGKMVP